MYSVFESNHWLEVVNVFKKGILQPSLGRFSQNFPRFRENLLNLLLFGIEEGFLYFLLITIKDTLLCFPFILLATCESIVLLSQALSHEWEYSLHMDSLQNGHLLDPRNLHFSQVDPVLEYSRHHQLAC